MSKKHFEALAAALRQVPSINQWDTWIGCVNAVADTCAKSNQRFDRARFLKACGVEN